MNTQSSGQQIPGKTGGARRDLFLILGMLIAVIITSTALYWAATSGRVNLPALLGTKNHGDLITPPRPLTEMALRDVDGQMFDFAKQKPHWTLLVPVAAHCDATCEKALYLTRQIHVAIGKNASRVQRLLISKDGAPDAAFATLLTQHAGAQVLLADPAAFDKLFADYASTHAYYVVDPAGWLMMAYRLDHNYQGVLTDLKFLLSNSHEDEPSGAQQ
jgi:cytochrome oxidase Cu insertion factor (SCO1/SenC/PrrC family)